nr:hypothetical protein [Ardenticatenales bacterium]
DLGKADTPTPTVKTPKTPETPTPEAPKTPETPTPEAPKTPETPTNQTPTNQTPTTKVDEPSPKPEAEAPKSPEEPAPPSMTQQVVEYLAEKFKIWDRNDLRKQLGAKVDDVPTEEFAGEVRDSLNYFVTKYPDNPVDAFSSTLRQRYTNSLKDFPELSSQFDEILAAGGDLSSKTDELTQMMHKLKTLEGLENASSLPRWMTRTGGRMLGAHGFDEMSNLAGRWVKNTGARVSGAMGDLAGWARKGPGPMLNDTRFGMNAFAQGGILPHHAVRLRDFGQKYGLDIAFRNTKLKTALGNLLGVPGKPESWGMFKGLPGSVANIKSNNWGLAYHGDPRSRDIFSPFIRSDYDLATIAGKADVAADDLPSIASTSLKVMLSDTQAQALVPFLDAAVRGIPSGLDEGTFKELMVWAGGFKPTDRIAEVVASAPVSVRQFMADYYTDKPFQQIFHSTHMTYPGNLKDLPTPSQLTVLMPDGSSVAMSGRDAYDYITSLQRQVKNADGNSEFVNLEWPWNIPSR